MPSLAREVRTCLLCRSGALHCVVSLNPLAIVTPNPGTLSSGNADLHAAVPLDLNLCRDCGQLQVSHVPDAEFQYREYTYKTSLSAGLALHFEAYAADLLKLYAPPRDGLVVEAGSNDGTLLRQFKAAGLRVLGVDPARAIAAEATAQGVETLPEFFSNALATDLRRNRGPADVFIANHCTANIEDMADFARGVRTLLSDDGIVVLETGYGLDVIEQNLLDTIYHEHLSYFMVKPLVEHYRRHGLEVIDVRRDDVKGGSIRIFAQPIGAGRPVAPAVNAMLEEEARKGVTDPAFYAKLPATIDRIRTELATIVAETRAAGLPVGGWGVSVGTSTLLSQFNLEHEIDFLVDDDPNKAATLIGPGYEIPVVSVEEFYRRNPGAVIVFAWRYIGPIAQRHQRYLDAGGKFVVPLPLPHLWA